MSDYKELIEDLRDDYKAWGDGRPLNFFEVTLRCKQAADAIEQLVNDRNASVDALKALHDNGVVVLPCKVGDTVYKVFDEKVWDMKAIAIPMLISSLGANLSVTCTNYRGAALTLELSEFGKTVFLTKEEAEEALAKQKEVTSDAG